MRYAVAFKDWASVDIMLDIVEAKSKEDAVLSLLHTWFDAYAADAVRDEIIDVPIEEIIEHFHEADNVLGIIEIPPQGG